MCVCAKDDFLGFILSYYQKFILTFPTLFSVDGIVVIQLFICSTLHLHTLFFVVWFCFRSVNECFLTYQGDWQERKVPKMNSTGSELPWQAMWSLGVRFFILWCESMDFTMAFYYSNDFFGVQLQAWWPLVCPKHLYCSFLPVSVFEMRNSCFDKNL